MPRIPPCFNEVVRKAGEEDDGVFRFFVVVLFSNVSFRWLRCVGDVGDVFFFFFGGGMLVVVFVWSLKKGSMG